MQVTGDPRTSTHYAQRKVKQRDNTRLITLSQQRPEPEVQRLVA